MDLGIKGKVALVAGGSAGMGKASAAALAREGVRLCISARGAERLEATRQELSESSLGPVQSVVADHGTEAGRARLFELCPAPDILVITFSPPPFNEDYRAISQDAWRESFDQMVIGSIELMRHYATDMAERGFGRIVNIGTLAAKYPFPIRMMSGATRAAVGNYSAALSKVLSKKNVTINTLLPGMFETPGGSANFRAKAAANGTTIEEERARFMRRLNIPAGTFGDPEDLGAICAMFCSTYMGYTVGQSLSVDGGLGGSLF